MIMIRGIKWFTLHRAEQKYKQSIWKALHRIADKFGSR